MEFSEMIGLLIFLCTIIGYMFVISQRVKVAFSFVPIVTFSWITLVLYFAGLLGRLKIVFFIIVVVGIICFLWFLYEKVWKEKVKGCLNYFHCFFLIISICFLAALVGSRFQHYDNFSHWGTVVKYILSTDAFPTMESELIEFSNYPLGTASWIYYVCRLCGREQGIMLWAQALLIFACFYAIFGIIRERKRFLLYAFMGAGLSALSILNITIRINNLLVDFLLPILALVVLAALYDYRDQLHKVTFVIAPILGLLVIVKSTGAIFMIFCMFYFIYMLCKVDKTYRWSRIFAFLTTFVLSVLPIICWNVHRRIAFQGVTNKFDITSEKIQSVYGQKSSDEIAQIVKLFLQSVFDLTSRPTICVVVFELLSIVGCITAYYVIHKKWALIKAIVALNLMLVLYYIGILAMYIYSMPLDEALYLAGFERYASSIVVLFCGALVLCATIDLENSFYIKIGNQEDYKSFKSVETKKYYQMSILVCLGIIAMLLLSEYNGMKYNDAQFASSLPAKVEAVTKDRWPEDGITDTSRYLFYASDADGQVTNYYMQYIGRYMLFASQVDGICSFYEDNLINLLQQYDYLVIVESDRDARYLMKKYFGEDGREGIYKVSDLLHHYSRQNNA